MLTQQREHAERPLEALVRLTRLGASGELIAASDATEIHVYLLEGRLAWATSAGERNAFIGHLVDDGVPAEAVREVVAECQRTRKRLGETLVAWGVASAAQVRAALAAQIGLALEAMATHAGAQTLFLSRRMEYARDLTFGLDDFLAPRQTSTIDVIAEQLVATVLDAMPEAAWVEVVADDGGPPVRVARGRARPNAAVGGVQRLLREQRLDSLSLRFADGAMLGQRIPGHAGSIWCALGPETKLGVASAVLGSATGATTAARAPTGGEIRERPGVVAGLPVPVPVIVGAMQTTDDVLAGIVIDRDGLAAGATRGGRELAALATVGGTLALALDPRLGEALPGNAAGRFYESVSVRATADDLAYYGMRLGDRATLWLILPAVASQGLGWALLQTVGRQVGEMFRSAP